MVKANFIDLKFLFCFVYIFGFLKVTERLIVSVSISNFAGFLLLLLLRSHDIGILSNLESGGLNKFHCLCQVIFSAIQFIIEGFGQVCCLSSA